MTDMEAETDNITQTNKRPEKKEKKKKKRVLLWIIAILVFLVSLAILLHELGLFRWPWEKPPLVVAGDLFPGSGGADDGHLSDMTEKEIQKQMQELVDAAYFSFKINARPIFENSSSEGTLEIENPSYNIYPMVVQITLDSTDEVIYDSGGILPDHHINNAKLLVRLPKGVHKATAHINAYDPKTKQLQGTQLAHLEITIKK
ncbi:MAG: hypothetical protein LBJ07_02365 [Actinomycetes bacterium]|jgi:hypothetical protein|nr:hypothetical protein [Actinomycetes bacterium]